VECGRTVSPCPHAHSTSRLTLALEGKTDHRHHSRGLSTLSMMVLKHSRASDYAILSIVCSFSRTGIFSVDLTQPGGEPLIGCHSRFSTEWNLVCFPSVFWGLVQVSLTHKLGDYIFFPSVVCVSFPGGFVAQDGLLFSPCCELCLLLRFGTVVIRLGVVLATIGPRTTKESFSLFKL